MYRHRFDTVSFVFGIIFVGLGLLFVIPGDAWDLLLFDIPVGWLLPVALVALGVMVIVPAIRRPSPPGIGFPDDQPEAPDEVIEEALAELPESPIE